MGKKTCPRCDSKDIVKYGKRYNIKGINQKYQCNDCGKKFSELAMKYKHDKQIRYILQFLSRTGRFSSRQLEKFSEEYLGEKVNHATICRWTSKHKKMKVNGQNDIFQE